MEQPKAVLHAPSISRPGASARAQATMRPTSVTWSRVPRLVLARLWPSLTLTGMVTRWAPAAWAAWAPRRLGARATMTQGRPRTACTTSAVSAICGIRREGTKLPTSISGMPTAAMACIQRILASVAMRVRDICRPSRGPTSHTVTLSFIAGPSH